MPQLTLPTIFAFVVYVLIVLAIGLYAYSKTKDAGDYFLGGRTLSPWVSAISAGASDMSGWILLGLPGYAYVAGLEAGWITLGLTIGVAANWLLVAKRLRIYSMILKDAVTIPAYLQRRFADKTPWLKSISALSILVFFLFYVGSGLIAGGKLFNVVFGLDYHVAVFVGVFLILVYTLFGGFLAVSWTDVFQGLLMLMALIAVPLFVIQQSGGVADSIAQLEGVNPYLLDIWTNASGEPLSALAIIGLLGWGLGYFGQPHILARFKALRSANDAGVAGAIGVVWAFLGYLMAILVGLCGLIYLADPLADPEKVFIALTGVVFHPLMAGVMLAAILAAIMSTVDSQLLVSSATLAEDLYPALVNREMAPETRLTVGRIAVVVLALLATGLAMDPESKVLDVVSYAWAGLGASIGPAIIISLYWSAMTARGALAGIVVGGLTVVVWSQLSGGWFDLYELVPGFIFASLAIVIVSKLDGRIDDEVFVSFDKMLTEFKGRG
ncbi:MAG: sodium/proline symporter PutP [Porticoccaceae bacterium]